MCPESADRKVYQPLIADYRELTFFIWVHRNVLEMGQRLCWPVIASDMAELFLSYAFASLALVFLDADTVERSVFDSTI